MPQEFIVSKNAYQTVKFTGELLGETSSLPPPDSPKRDKNPAAKRWFVLKAYSIATKEPCYLGSAEFHSAFPAEPSATVSANFPTLKEVFDWFRNDFDPCNPELWNWKPWNDHRAEDRVMMVKDAVRSWYLSAVSKLAAKCLPPEVLS
jgi:hypothetical protein